MENWKDIEGFEGRYQVSDLGRIKSLARKSINGKQLQEKILKPGISSGGYLTLKLYKDDISKSRDVHQLVAIAFLGHNPNGPNIVVDHIDNNPSNNIVENLQLITNRENCSKDKKGGSSRYVGVYWNKGANKWQAQIKIDGKLKYLGLFKEETEAHKAYQSRLKEVTYERV